jgi:hypothetical protein
LPFPFKEPEDTVDAIFLRRAVEEIRRAMFPDASPQVDKIHKAVAEAIEKGLLEILARNVEETRSVYGIVPRWARTPEGWREAVRSSQLDEFDQRPDSTIRRRRRIPVPHWLFVTRASLGRFLAPFNRTTSGDEARAIKALEGLLRKDPNLSKAQARQRLSHLKFSARGFETRIWPKGRAAAGLPEKGKSGRKPRARTE